MTGGASIMSFIGRVLMLAIFAFTAVPSSAEGQSYDYWFGPTIWWSQDELSVEPLIAFTRLRSSQIGTDLQLTIPLVLPSDVQIEKLTMCYRMNDPGDFITERALVSWTVPGIAGHVLLRDDTALNDLGGTCTERLLDSPGAVSGLISLELTVRFSGAGVNNNIYLGAIKVTVSSTTSAAVENVHDPVGLTLDPNRPNPLYSETIIEYTMESAGRVNLSVFDVAGREIRSLLDTEQGSGTHQVKWDGRNDCGRDLPAGVYLTRITTSAGTRTGRVVLMR
jgi:hypothetical protein